MTTAEQKIIQQVAELMQQIRVENNNFRNDIASQIQAINAKVDKKHLPLTLEQDVLSAVNGAIAKGMADALSNSYNSPLVQYAKNVVENYKGEIEAIFNKVVDEGIRTDEFKSRVREVLLNKIAKTVISGIDGSVDKTINLMKQDAVFRSKLTLAVNGVVNDFLSHN